MDVCELSNQSSRLANSLRLTFCGGCGTQTDVDSNRATMLDSELLARITSAFKVIPNESFYLEPWCGVSLHLVGTLGSKFRTGLFSTSRIGLSLYICTSDTRCMVVRIIHKCNSRRLREIQSFYIVHDGSHGWLLS